jgi:outer membrane receptor protein involved in Fe transport
MVHEKSWVASFRLGVFVLLALGLTFCLPLRAQTFHGSILGTVSDPSGAAIAGASVTAKNTASGYVRTTHTTEDGTYWIPELPVGMYEVTVTMTGFQGAFASSVPVEVARDRRVDFGLTHANALQQKTQDTGVPIETTNNTQGTSFQSKEILNLPVDGRDIDELYVMAPGVAGNPSGVAGAPGAYGQFSANGNRDRSNNFLLNGGDINDSYRNLPAINQGAVYGLPSAALPLESVGEVRIQTNFDAQYGRNSGAVVNVLTNTGTNGFHGSLFEYFGNNVLNARNFFNTVGPKDAFRNNQFGGDLGGPITRDKTHFFFAYQGQREGMGLTSLNTVPTLANYQTAVTNIAGPNPGACDPTVPANTIEGCVAANLSAFNPVIQNLYNLCGSTRKCSGGTLPWPLPNAALANGLNNISSDRSRNNVDSLLLNVDHSFNSSNTMSGHFYYGRGDQSLPLGIAGGNIMPGTNTHATPDVYVGSVSLVSVISPTQTNEARFGYNRYHVGLFAQDASVFGNPAVSLGLDTTLGTVTGAPNPQDFGLPTLKVGGLSSLGSSAQANPQARVDRNYQFADNFAWKFSKNNVRMGFEIRHTSIDSLQDLNFRGTIGFDNLTSFLEGLDNTCSSCYINYGNTQRYTQQDSFGLFIQDSWQILPRLTVNAGLRWDFDGPLSEKYGRLTGFDPSKYNYVQCKVNGQPADPALTNYNGGQCDANTDVITSSGLIIAGNNKTGATPGASDSLMKNHQWGFAPRIGVAWTPFTKITVRAGYGIYYDRGELFSYLSPSAGSGFNGPFGCPADLNGERSDSFSALRNYPATTTPGHRRGLSGLPA